MLNVYTAKRREPRIRLRTRVSISGSDASGREFSDETVTIDVSPRGASVVIDREIPIGTPVEFRALKYAYTTRAVVKSFHRDRVSGAMAIGLEFLGDTPNPLVIWSASSAAAFSAADRLPDQNAR